MLTGLSTTQTTTISYQADAINSAHLELQGSAELCRPFELLTTCTEFQCLTCHIYSRRHHHHDLSFQQTRFANLKARGSEVSQEVLAIMAIYELAIPRIGIGLNCLVIPSWRLVFVADN